MNSHIDHQEGVPKQMPEPSARTEGNLAYRPAALLAMLALPAIAGGCIPRAVYDKTPEQKADPSICYYLDNANQKQPGKLSMCTLKLKPGAENLETAEDVADMLARNKYEIDQCTSLPVSYQFPGSRTVVQVMCLAGTEKPGVVKQVNSCNYAFSLNSPKFFGIENIQFQHFRTDRHDYSDHYNLKPGWGTFNEPNSKGITLFTFPALAQDCKITIVADDKLEIVPE